VRYHEPPSWPITVETEARAGIHRQSSSWPAHPEIEIATGGERPVTRLLLVVDERSRPEVIVDLDFERGLLFLVVRNIGERPALDVATTFDRKLVGLGGSKEVSALPLFRNIAFLAPAKEIRTLLDSAGSWFARRRATKITARVTYRDPDGKEYAGTMRHDLEIYRELAYVRGE
jgi:hypothetical protein